METLTKGARRELAIFIKKVRYYTVKSITIRKIDYFCR